MRVLVLVDAKNFEQGIFEISKERNEFRFIDFNRLSHFIIDYLKNNLQYKNSNLEHIRTYFYTGEYTDKLIDKIEKHLEKKPEEADLIKNLLDRCKKDQAKQQYFFNLAKGYYFFEIRAKPLQFSYTDIRVFQKGVDVQLAVDLVDFSHKNIFDIAVILSGDIDLLESIKAAKNMGKHIIIFGNSNITAEEMKRYSDWFIDTSKFSVEQLNKFTHIPQNKEAFQT